MQMVNLTLILIKVSDHLNESYWTVLSRSGTAYYAMLSLNLWMLYKIVD